MSEKPKEQFREWLLFNHHLIINEEINTWGIAEKAAEIFGRKLVPGDYASARQHLFAPLPLEQLERKLEQLKVSPPQPTVIEGKGQAVTVNAEQITYWQKRLAKCRDGIYPLRFGCSDTASGGITITDDSVNVWDVLQQLYHDAELLRDFANEILPPRPAFVPPEKPELVLVRYPSGKEEYMTRREWERGGSGEMTVIDETTGKPTGEVWDVRYVQGEATCAAARAERKPIPTGEPSEVSK